MTFDKENVCLVTFQERHVSGRRQRVERHPLAPERAAPALVLLLRRRLVRPGAPKTNAPETPGLRGAAHGRHS